MNTYDSKLGLKLKFWTPDEDLEFKEFNNVINITIGKKYEIRFDNDDYYIIDDSGKPSGIFNAHNGRFE